MSTLLSKVSDQAVEQRTVRVIIELDCIRAHVVHSGAKFVAQGYKMRHVVGGDGHKQACPITEAPDDAKSWFNAVRKEVSVPILSNRGPVLLPLLRSWQYQSNGLCNTRQPLSNIHASMRAQLAGGVEEMIEDDVCCIIPREGAWVVSVTAGKIHGFDHRVELKLPIQCCIENERRGVAGASEVRCACIEPVHGVNWALCPVSRVLGFNGVTERDPKRAVVHSDSWNHHLCPHAAVDIGKLSVVGHVVCVQMVVGVGSGFVEMGMQKLM